MGYLSDYPAGAFPTPPPHTHRIANAVLGVVRAVLPWIPGGRRSAAPKTILVLRLGNLGDIIVSLPAFHALRKQFPNSRLILLTSPTKRGAPGAVEVLANDASFDDMIVYYDDESSKPGFLRALRRDIRDRGVDHVVYLPADLTNLDNVLKHVALFVAAGVRSFQGLHLFAAPWLEAHTTDRLLHLIGADTPAEAFPWLTAPESDQAHVETLLTEAGGKPLVALQCGSKRLANRWAPEHFAAVGRALVARHDCWIVLPGSPGEAALTAEVAAGIGERCIDLAGKTSISQLSALAARCRVFVTNDTGTMHVAVAMGVPVVAIFGGRYYPYVWHPYGDAHVILRAPIECSPCKAEACPLYEVPECLNRISPETVIAAAESFLGSAQR